MPQKKAKKNAAKIRINKQVRDLDTGQFEFNDDKFEFTFSEDSSDDDYNAERFEKLNLVWFDSADNNVKKNILEILEQHIFENMTLQKHLLKLLNYHNQ